MSWKGKWNKEGTVFAGTYEFPDGTVFEGEARFLDYQLHVHTNADGYSKVDKSPTEPHFEFHGTWKKDDGAGSAMMPPDPEK